MNATTEALAVLLPPDRLDDAIQLMEEPALQKFELMAAEIRGISEAVTAGPLKSAAEEGQAAELIARGTIALKELDALRRKHTDPLNEQVKGINGLFKVVTEPCEALVGKAGKLDKLILAWRAQERARIAREESETRRRQEEAAVAEAEAVARAQQAPTDEARQAALAEAEAASQAQAVATIEAPAPMTKGVRTDSGSIREREVWVFQVVDAAQVPRSFCVPDERAIRAAVAGGVRSIPGVAISVEDRLTRRVG